MKYLGKKIKFRSLVKGNEDSGKVIALQTESNARSVCASMLARYTPPPGSPKDPPGILWYNKFRFPVLLGYTASLEAGFNNSNREPVRRRGVPS